MYKDYIRSRYFHHTCTFLITNNQILTAVSAPYTAGEDAFHVAHVPSCELTAYNTAARRQYYLTGDHWIVYNHSYQCHRLWDLYIRTIRTIEPTKPTHELDATFGEDIVTIEW